MSKAKEGHGKEKFAVYSRKSKFTGKGESVENQIEMCRQYIKTHYENVSDEDIFTYEDEGFSGKNTERPSFKAMMADAHKRKFGTIVCYRFDRISRNIADFANLIQEFESLAISFVSIKENFDTTSPMGRAMMHITSVFSQLERETISERICDNMYELAKHGRWLGGKTPTGYKSVPFSTTDENGKSKTQHKLEIIPEEAEIVKTIFRKFGEVNSLTKTEQYLQQNHIMTKNSVPFLRFSIRNILTNPVYTVADETVWEYLKKEGIDIHSDKAQFDGEHGVMAYNKTNQSNRRLNQIREPSEWIVAVGKHNGIIPGEEWVRVQELLKQNSSKSYRKPRSHVALLSGLLFCGKCNNYMRPKMTQRKNKDNEIIYDYLCQTKEKTLGCNCNVKRANGNELDKAVCEQIKMLAADKSAFMKKLDEMKKCVKSDTEETVNRIEALRKSYAENETEILGLVKALAKAEERGDVSYEYINRRIAELHEINGNLNNQIAEWEQLSENRALSGLQFDILRDTVIDFGKSYDTMTVEQKRIAIRMCVERVVWDGLNVHIFLFGSEPLGGDSKSNKNVLS